MEIIHIANYSTDTVCLSVYKRNNNNNIYNKPMDLNDLFGTEAFKTNLSTQQDKEVENANILDILHSFSKPNGKTSITKKYSKSGMTDNNLITRGLTDNVLEGGVTPMIEDKVIYNDPFNAFNNRKTAYNRMSEQKNRSDRIIPNNRHNERADNDDSCIRKHGPVSCDVEEDTVTHKFKTDLQAHLRTTQNAGYTVTITDPEIYSKGVKDAKRMFDISLLQKGLDTVGTVNANQLKVLGDQSILITEECSQVGNTLYENQHQIKTQTQMGLIANRSILPPKKPCVSQSSASSITEDGDDNEDSYYCIEDDDDDAVDDDDDTHTDTNMNDSLIDRPLTQHEVWENNIMEDFKNANSDFFFIKSSQIDTLIDKKHQKNKRKRHNQQTSDVDDHVIEDACPRVLLKTTNDLLAPLEGERDMMQYMPTIRRNYNQNFYRPVIKDTGERPCCNGEHCKIFQCYYQMVMSSRRQLIRMKWCDKRKQNMTQKPCSQNKGTDIASNYQQHAIRYRKQNPNADSVDSDKDLVKPTVLREFLTPQENEERTNALVTQLAIFDNEINARYSAKMNKCNNNDERAALKFNMRREIDSYITNIGARISHDRPANPCLLCCLSETARLARNCCNNSPLHNPELNVLVQKFANVFGEPGEYKLQHKFTCGTNFHGIIKPILDFNVDNYLPTRTTVACSVIMVDYDFKNTQATTSTDSSRVDQSTQRLCKIRLENKLQTINAWAEYDGMMHTIEDSIASNNTSM